MYRVNDIGRFAREVISDLNESPRSSSLRYELKMVFLTNESASKAEINILSARDTTRPGP